MSGEPLFIDETQAARLKKLLADYEAGRLTALTPQTSPRGTAIEVYWGHTTGAIASNASGTATIYAVGGASQGFTVPVVNTSGYDWSGGFFLALIRDVFTGNYFPANVYGCASATVGGLICNGFQQIAGGKEFLSDVAVDGTLSANAIVCTSLQLPGSTGIYGQPLLFQTQTEGAGFQGLYLNFYSGSIAGSINTLDIGYAFSWKEVLSGQPDCGFYFEFGEFHSIGNLFADAGSLGTLGDVHAAHAYYAQGSGGASGTDSIGNVFLGGIVTTVGSGGAPAIAVGTTSITSGSTDGLLFDNGGVLGIVSAPTSGQILVGGSAPSFVSLSGDATLASTGIITLKNTGSTGTYGQVTTDAQGRVTSGATCDVGHGGTGQTTLTAHNVLIGAGSGITVAAPGTSGYVLTSNGSSSDPTFQAPATAGTVTSIAVAVPTGFTVSGSPVTTSGTVTIGLSTESPNLVWAAPASGTTAAAPTFRSIVAADLPTIAVGGGGTGQTTLTAHNVLIGAGTSGITVAAPSTSGYVLTSNGSSSDPTFQAFPAANTLPSGLILPYLGSAAPTGWLLADGSWYRGATYPDLYTACTHQQTGTLVGSTVTVTGLSTGSLQVGDIITGTGIDAYDCYVVSIDSGSQIHMSNEALSNGAETLTFTKFLPAPPIAGPFVIGASCTASSGSTTIVSSTTLPAGMVVGDTVYDGGFGVPAGATVAALVSSTKFTINVTATANQTKQMDFWPGDMFMVPNMTGRVPVGQDTLGTVLATNHPGIGTTFGEENHVLTTAEMPAHTHAFNLAVSSGLAGGSNYTLSGASGVNSTSTGGGGAHNNCQPSIGLNYIIKT